MAGTIFSLAMSQRLDSQGRPLLNAPLYFYEANTSDPVNAFADFGLSVLHPWPLRTDGAGMIPPFWLPDGDYRVRLTDEAGSIVFFDIQQVQTVGPSTGEGGGGGGSGVDPNSVHQTGDMIWTPISGVRAGWVRANGRTIGSATSGAAERANADTQPVYEFLWNNFSNTLCPVSGGRGANAASDFFANKPIATLDMRGRGPMGLDDMGSSGAGVITQGTPTDPGSGGGSESRSFTVTKNNLPDYQLPLSVFLTGSPSNLARNMNWSTTTAQGTANTNLVRNLSVSNTNLGVSGSVRLDGGGKAISINTMSPYRLGTWFIRL